VPVETRHCRRASPVDCDSAVVHRDESLICIFKSGTEYTCDTALTIPMILKGFFNNLLEGNFGFAAKFLLLFFGFLIFPQLVFKFVRQVELHAFN
jgi:hypothetical protein